MNVTARAVIRINRPNNEGATDVSIANFTARPCDPRSGAPRRGTARRVPLIALVLAVATILVGCGVDVNVAVTMRENGSGVIKVTVTADDDVRAHAPNLVSDLRLDDLEAAGWRVGAPTQTADGGIKLELEISYSNPPQATRILADMNGPEGPLSSFRLTLTSTDAATTYAVSGSLRATEGTRAYADAELLTALGSAPYLDQLIQAGAPPSVVSFTIEARLPGVIQSNTAPGGETMRWSAPASGNAVEFSSTTRLERSSSMWLKHLAKLAAIALVTWSLVAAGLIGYVTVIRRRRSRQRALR